MSITQIIHFFIILICFTKCVMNAQSKLQCEHSGSSRSPIVKIKEKILCNYDKDYRPIKDQSKAINVSVRLVVKSIDVMDENNEFDMHDWMGLVWKDEFLTWNPDEFNSVKSIHISGSEIWVPDIKVFKEHDNSEKAMSGTGDCIIQNTGLVSCVTDNMHDGTCTSNTDKWPHDTRLCTLRYTAGIYNTSQVRLKQVLIMKIYFQNPEWKLLNSSGLVGLLKNPVDNGTYYQLKYHFNLERHSARVIALIYVPALCKSFTLEFISFQIIFFWCIALVTLSLLPLWMKPGNVERFCLVAANILSHFFFIQHMDYIVPSTGNKLPRIVSFFRDSLGISVVVLIELTLIKSLVGNRKSEAPKWLSTPCKFLSAGVFGRTLLLPENRQQQDTTNEGNTTNDGNTNMVAVIENDQNENDKEAAAEMEMSKTQVEKYLIATIIDRLVFAFLALVYFILIVCLIPL